MFASCLASTEGESKKKSLFVEEILGASGKVKQSLLWNKKANKKFLRSASNKVKRSLLRKKRPAKRLLGVLLVK